jgi:hypothetical protein
MNTEFGKDVKGAGCACFDIRLSTNSLSGWNKEVYKPARFEQGKIRVGANFLEGHIKVVEIIFVSYHNSTSWRICNENVPKYT